MPTTPRPPASDAPDIVPVAWQHRYRTMRYGEWGVWSEWLPGMADRQHEDTIHQYEDRALVPADALAALRAELAAANEGHADARANFLTMQNAANKLRIAKEAAEAEVARLTAGSFVRRAAAALSCLAGEGWRPIETAPKCVASSERDNGLRPVLVTRWPVVGHHNPIAVARLTNDGWIAGRGGPWRKKLWFDPTHWLSFDALPPLPAPSVEEKLP